MEYRVVDDIKIVKHDIMKVGGGYKYCGLLGWMQGIPSKHCHSWTKVYIVTSQKTIILTLKFIFKLVRKKIAKMWHMESQVQEM